MEVGSQGQDWGWLRDHSLKGASAPQLAGRESGKNSGHAEGKRPLFQGVRGEEIPSLSAHRRQSTT